MAISEVSICNQALSWVGGNRITSLQDEAEEARICLANYEGVRDAVLEARAWTFATTRKTLVRLSADREWGDKRAFQLPADNIRVLSVFEDDERRTREEWFIEGETLVIGVDVVNIKYLQRVTSPSRFSPAFVQAVAARLAADISIPLAQSARLQKDMWTLYERKLREAASLDGMQGTREKVRSDALIRVRR